MKWTPLHNKYEGDLENDLLLFDLAKKALEPEGQTIIHCTYVSKRKYVNGGWVNINKNTFLVNPDTKDMLTMVDPTKKDMLYMVQAFNVPVSPGRHVFTRAGQLKRFTLLFPQVPKHWKRFHLLEIADPENGFRITDIVRNDTGVYHIELT